VVRTRTDELLLGEWACLALLTQGPAHGYDIATRLAPAGDIGRVWSLSRPLTYRAIDQLTQRGLIVPVAEEKGKAGGNRTILSATPQGRRLVRRWLEQPVPHFRAVRDELLLKLVLLHALGTDPLKLLQSQRALFEPMVDALAAAGGRSKAASDPVAVWRYESSRSALRFIDRMIAADRHAHTG
jgi:DNA-binding PadR family transcriptional regulator